MYSPSLLERISLVLLLFLSILLFWQRFGKVWRQITTAKTEPGYTTGALGRRSWRFFSEIICQSKVIRERPLPGLAHAFVFWGFCAFALVTLCHLASGLGVPLFDRSRGFGLLYYWFAFGFAAAVAVSIAGLFIRRFIIRPKWLGPLSYESGVIAGLIFLLMVTYMAEWWVPDQTLNGHLLWWAHTLCLLGFLPLIPHTKHLHLLLSPAAIFFDREQFSSIPPLEGDEDFGLVTGADVTRVTALQAYSCVECGRCTEHCPANNTGKELNPKLIALGVRDYLNEYGNRSSQPLLEASISQTAIFQCTTCGACEYQCPVGIQHLPMIIGLRRGAVNTGKWEDEYGTKLFLNLEKHGNAMGFPQSERDKFVARERFPIFDGSQEYCLWLGCMGAYDPQGKAIISAFAEVMNFLGTSYGVLKRERCTGDPARRLGNDLVFADLATKNLELFAQQSVTRLVSICPHCVRTIAEDWREFGAQVTVEHHSEFLARHQAQLPAGQNRGKVVYHDPCYLGRYRGSYDEPRAVIARSGWERVEPRRTRERAFCCGAGGGLVFLGEETGRRVNHTRAEELASTGAAVVAAACPFCNSMFRDALGALAEPPPQLVDIAQLTAASLPKLAALPES